MNKKSANKQSYPQLRPKLKPVYAAVLLAFAVQAAHANPTGGAVAAGQASFATSGNTLTVTNTPGTIINWQGFSIGANEVTHFNQQSASSAVLNRVTGSNLSNILGTLQSNGRVFLVNPNGIVFGAGSTVDVAGLVASTLNLSDADFLAGNHHYTQIHGAQNISNAGNIAAQDGGQIYLIAPNVENTGVITAPNGEILLAAGASVDLVNTSNPNLRVSITAPAGDATNVGELVASSGSLGLFGVVVRNSGTVSANSATLQGGKIVFKASQRVEAGGTISASGVGGGNISILTDMRSGTVNVSGTLDASAPVSGNGGFVETSAANVNIANGVKVTTAAASGLSGTWLIDPFDFTIAATGGNMTGAVLSASLGLGAVTIASTSGTTGTLGDVNVNDAVTWAANQLTLNAQNNININANLNGSGTASLALQYGQLTSTGGTSNYFLNNGAQVNLPAGLNFSTQLGSLGAVKNFTVITTLGAAADAVTSPATMTLQGMAVSTNLAGNYVLGSNIDAAATSTWNAGAGFTPVGSSSTFFSFTGTFDGLGHTISNLTINLPSTNFVGLFGSTGTISVVRNVGLVGGSVTGNSYVGGLVGINQGTISNSYATDSVSGGNKVGGLVGFNNSGTISNSYAAGSVTGPIEVGGLVGRNYIGMISNSYASGNIIATTTTAGGLVGNNVNGTISNSYATGNVSGASYAGGLSGVNCWSGNINNSYATGSVTGTSGVGGLAGYNEGVAGHGTSSISNSYSTGLVTGTTNVGGLVGWNNVATVTASFWDTTTSGQPTVGIGAGTTTGATGLATTAFSTANSFTGFNFTSTPGAAGNNWVIVNGDGTLQANGSVLVGNTRPMLASEYSTTINNAHQLQLMEMNLAGNYTLAANINAAATNGATNPSGMWGSAGFVPIGTNSTASTASEFTGTFDGLGHTISNLTVNLPVANNVGLFGYTAAGSIIQNVGLVGGSVTGTGNSVGALVGYNYGTISNAYATGSVSGNINVGALVGYNNHGTISNSYAAGSVSGAGDVGGLVGYNGNYGTISNSYATGSVSGTSTVGGLVGVSNALGTISNSYATGNVSGSNYVGGLVGWIYTNCTVSNSYATGSVVGTGNAVGGLVGRNYYGTVSNSYATGSVSGSNYVGGLVGFNWGGTVNNSYAAGVVSGTTLVGGLVGAGTGGTVTNSFWNTATSLQATSAGGTGYTTAQMQTMSNFTGWSIANTGGSTAVWRIYEGMTAPLLRSFMTAVTLTPTYNGTAQTLTNTGDYTANIAGLNAANILGGASGLTLNSSVVAGSYTASFTSNNFSSIQQGYDITVANRVITGTGSAANDIAINNALTWGAGSLTVNAANIAINAALNGGAGGISLAASGNINVNALIKTGTYLSGATAGNAGDVSLTAGGNILLSVTGTAIDASIGADGAGTTTGRGGDVSLIAGGSIIGAASDIGSYVVKNQPGSTGSRAGNITLVANGGNVTIGNLAAWTYQNDSSGIIGNGGNVALTASGSVTVGAVDTQARGAYNNWGGTTIIGNGGNVSMTSTTGGITLNGAVNAGAVNGGFATTVGTSGNISLSGAGIISQAAGATITGALLTTSSAGGTTLNAANAVSGFNATNNAGGGISLTDTVSLTTAGISDAGGGGVTINDAGGIFTVANLATVSTSNAPLNITANDVVLTGMLNSGTAATTITASGGGSIGLGAEGNLTLDGVELQNITASTLNLNSTGVVSVNGITAANSNTVGAVVINETGNSTVSFGTSASIFKALTVNGDSGIVIQSNLSTNTGDLILNGNSNVGFNYYDGIATQGGVVLSSAGNLTIGPNGPLAVADGYIYGAGAIPGSLTLSAVNGINVNSPIIGNGEAIAINGGGIALNGSVTNGAFNITLNSTGIISQAAGAGISTTGLLTTSSVGGTTLNNANTVAGFNATNSGSGGISLSNTAATLSVTGISNTVGTVTVNNTGAISTTGAVVGTTINEQATVGVTLGAAATLTASAAGDAIVLNAGAGNFVNNGTAGVLALTGGGRWLVYSNSPLLDMRGALTYNFKQYNTAFGGTILGAGNGFVYTLAPTVTYTLTGVTKVYDGTAIAALTAANYSAATGAIDGDIVSAPATATGSYNTMNVSAVSASAVGAASATNGAAAVYGYTYTATGIASITPATLSYVANAASRLYGGTDPAFSGTVTGFVLTDTLSSATTGAASYATTALNTNNVGSYAIDGSGLTANFGNYVFAQAAGNSSAYAINPALLSVTANNASKTYGAIQTYLGTEFTSTGLVNGETVGSVTLASTGDVATANVAGSPYTINASTATGGTFAASNYTISYVNGALAVNPTALSVIADIQSKVYGNADPALTYVAAGLVNGETTAVLTGALSRVTGENVNTYAINQGTLANGNYTISYTGNSLTITPAALTLTANNASKIYGATQTYLGTEFTSAGLVNGETIGSVTLASTGDVATANVAGNPYAINVSTATGGTFAAGNYTISYVNGAQTVNPALLTVSANAASKTYDGLAYTGGNGVAYSGFVNGETSSVLGGALAYGGTAQGAINVSSYLISSSGLTSGNYAIIYVNGVLTVNPASLTVTANNASKIYGATQTYLGTEFTSAGLVNGETIGSVALASAGAVASANVAGNPYAINVSTATGGTFAAGNYTISYVNGALAVNPAALSVIADIQSKVYGNADPALTYVATGLVNGETTAVLTGALSRVTGENVNTYAINQGSLADGNYTISYTGNSLTITPAALTANVTSNYTLSYVGATLTILAPTVTNEIVNVSVQNTTSSDTQEKPKETAVVVADAGTPVSGTAKQSLPVCN